MLLISGPLYQEFSLVILACSYILLIPDCVNAEILLSVPSLFLDDVDDGGGDDE
jgi:hypothetical protein